MSTLVLRVLERIHGHVGWLAVAALLHPAILLRNPRRRAPVAVVLTTLFVTFAGGLGAFIYPEYRRHLKQAIFLSAPSIGWLFERKEHLAVGCLGFAWIGAIAHVTAHRFEDEETNRWMAVASHRSYVAAFVFASLVASIGVAVASYRSF